MKLLAAIKEYIVEIQVRKYSPRTIKSYENNLRIFQRFCEQEANVTEATSYSEFQS